MSCKGTKADGTPCKSPVVDDSGFCRAHGEGGSEFKARVSAAGVAGRAKKAEFDTATLPELRTTADAEKWLEAILRGILDGRIDRNDGNAATRAVEAWVKARSANIADQLERLEKRTKQIERLLEQKAREPAGAMR